MSPQDNPSEPGDRAEHRRPAPRDLRTVEEVARFLGCHPRSVRNYVARGLLPAYRILGTRGIRLDINEVNRAMRLVPTTVARPGATAFGPNAKITVIDPGPQVVRAEIVPPRASAD